MRKIITDIMTLEKERSMKLRLDGLYEVQRKSADERYKQNKKDRMIFLGELGEGKSGMLLFRHPKGYKETFLKSSIGNDIEVREVGK